MSSQLRKKWKEEAWEEFLSQYWDKRKKGAEFVEYGKDELSPILEKYTKSGQGEIRIFHSGHIRCEAVRKRGVMELPVSRNEWVLVKVPPNINFETPTDAVILFPKRELTTGMLAALTNRKSTPGETTMLAVARHAGILEDFYGLENEGVMFTGGRQSADGCHIIINDESLDLSKAQIEIDGGFEWAKKIVIVEVKSSLNQKNFEINQALMPLLKWRNLVPTKNVHSMVLLCSLRADEIAYHAYDLVPDTTTSAIGMRVVKSKKYILKFK